MTMAIVTAALIVSSSIVMTVDRAAASPGFVGAVVLAVGAGVRCQGRSSPRLRCRKSRRSSHLGPLVSHSANEAERLDALLASSIRPGRGPTT